MSGYLEQIKFLVVEDNNFMRTIVRRVLNALGAHDVKEAVDGAEAMKLLQTYQPDICIVDWEMTPLDGIDFARMIRLGEDSPNPFMPLIMLSGHSERQRVMVARDAGVNEFVVKPISATALFSRIRAVIERPRPFVRTKNYFGPDRRRHADAKYQGPERRGDGIDKRAAPDESMGQDAINALFNPDTEGADPGKT